MHFSTQVVSKLKHLTQESREEEIAEFVDRIRMHPAKRNLLVELLPERHPLYKDRSSNQINHIRGYILSTFGQVGLPIPALTYVLQELENSRDAYSVAAAAKALRGMKNPAVQVVPFLLKAIDNIHNMDDAVSFEVYKLQVPLKNYTTALNEIFLTFQWLGAYAKAALTILEELYDGNGRFFNTETRMQIQKTIQCISEDKRKVDVSCCTFSLADLSTCDKNASHYNTLDIPLEDQDGQVISFEKFFVGAPSVVVFMLYSE